MLNRQALSKRERTLYSKLHYILNQPGILKGSLVLMKRSCGKMNCKCQKSEDDKHISLYLSISQEGKQRMIYIPGKFEKEVREWTERYAEIRTVVERISLAFLERIQKKEK